MSEYQIPEIYVGGEKMLLGECDTQPTLEIIVGSVSKFCFDQKPPQMIVSATADGNDLDLQNPDEDFDISTVKSLYFEIMTLQDVALHHLGAIAGLVQGFDTLLKLQDNSVPSNNIEEKLKSIIASYNNARTEIVQLFPTAKINKLFYSFHKEIDFLNNVLFKPIYVANCFVSYDEKTIKMATEKIKNCKVMLKMIESEIKEVSEKGNFQPASYDCTLLGTFEAINNLLPKLSDCTQDIIPDVIVDLMNILDNSNKFWQLFTKLYGVESCTPVNESFFENVTNQTKELTKLIAEKKYESVITLFKDKFVPIVSELEDFYIKMLKDK